MIPEKNVQYSSREFWEKRYSENNKNNRDWLGDYSLFDDIFRKNVPKNSSILILGKFFFV